MEPVTNLNQFFTDAIQALNDQAELNAKVSELSSDKTRLENALEDEKVKVAKQIETSTEKRRAEINRTYDKEIDKANEELNKARNKRRQARNQGVKSRIIAETGDLKDDVRARENQIRTAMRQDGVPFYCNSGLFRALFYPRKLTDFLIIFLTLAICFFVIPYGVFRLFFADKGTVALVIIYVIDVLVFGGLYVLISKNAVYKHKQTLEYILELRKVIDQNKDSIRKITRSIEDDKDDNKYDLASYDDSIAHIKQQLADITMKKGDALHTFDTVTRNIIADELNNNSKEKIDGLASDLAQVSAHLTETENLRKQHSLELSNKYEVYLGKEFMTVDKIEALRDIVAHGTATNISEAIEEYNRRIDEL